MIISFGFRPAIHALLFSGTFRTKPCARQSVIFRFSTRAKFLRVRRRFRLSRNQPRCCPVLYSIRRHCRRNVMFGTRVIFSNETSRWLRDRHQTNVYIAPGGGERKIKKYKPENNTSACLLLFRRFVTEAYIWIAITKHGTQKKKKEKRKATTLKRKWGAIL